MMVTASLLIKPIARALDPVIRWIFSSEGQLAEGNLQRNPGRASIEATVKPASGDHLREHAGQRQ